MQLVEQAVPLKPLKLGTIRNSSFNPMRINVLK